MISPRLVRVCGFWNTEWMDCNGRPWFCMDKLNEYVHIPASAEYIWVEGSRKQWEDKSGTKVVLSNSGFSVAYYDNKNLYSVLFRELKNIIIDKKFVPEGNTVVYFRVWYI